jgi:hypothetical protein
MDGKERSRSALLRRKHFSEWKNTFVSSPMGVQRNIKSGVGVTLFFGCRRHRDNNLAIMEI